MSPKSSEQFNKMRSESRERILMAALECFAIDGYHNSSVSKVAKHAGVSKGLMYNYFENKEELLLECLALAFKDAEELLGDIVGKIQGMKPHEVFEFMINSFFEMLVNNEKIFRLTMSLGLQVNNIPTIHKVIMKVFNGAIMKMEGLLGIIGYEDVKEEAKFLAATMDGIAIHYLVFGKDYDLELTRKKLLSKYIKQ